MKGAIFDMDGLMFDTERIWQDTWHQIASEHHVVLDPGFGKAVTGTSGPKREAVIREYYHVSDGHPIDEECVKRIHAYLEKTVPEKPGIHEILSWLHDHGYKIAVASSTESRQIEHNLEMTNTRQYIDAVCSGTQVAHSKPAPDVFLYAAECIHVPIAECYIFEDAFNGIRAAYNAGGVGIMVPDTQAPDEEMRQKAHAICRDLNEALALIQKESAQ
ncbi:MAG: HAD family phosphatase [Erysipelotrichaceae bacterium]|jgi:HAD superfamily hydrolase (TIGR01509 family)|uniref:HAD family phosphatase n=1 Tax=Grylomicrobium aquisgranensis TaxID=2926318 RepID=A0AB35U2Z4_9FIRM|nr:HAD family phosphatase [Lactimicrobium massiliense]MCH4019575.1 HAD family phosphatase [Erysipelotrichaceae bacterium]MCI1326680.1 HAD family phosphatase [Solobacterium sp.]MDX8419855.1 HAD family phosphatase [Stecheria sp. CLA-KB-P133]MCH4045429.1 HAD family phosphatase [Erysipelotrichaceae bacterium]MCH4122640.1 HAD family phosphatase [Erysipelotrichaceae bacterium]